MYFFCTQFLLKIEALFWTVVSHASVLVKYRNEHKRMVQKLNIGEFASLDFRLTIHVVVSLWWSPQLGKMYFVMGFGLLITQSTYSWTSKWTQGNLQNTFKASIRILFSQPSGRKSSYCCTHYELFSLDVSVQNKFPAHNWLHPKYSKGAGLILVRWRS
jgi:hypothetical protein